MLRSKFNHVSKGDPRGKIMVMQIVVDVSWVGVGLDTQLIEVSVNQAMIGPDNGLAPNRRQAIIWTNHGTLLIEPLRTNLRRILMKIKQFSSKNALEYVDSKMVAIVSQTQLLWVWMTIYVYQKPGHKVSHICLYAAKIPVPTSYILFHSTYSSNWWPQCTFLWRELWLESPQMITD